MIERTDVAIVGGGIVGVSAARELAAAGLSVTVIERDDPGAAATRAAAGILSPQTESRGPGALLEFAIAGREEYPLFVEELSRETGLDIGYHSSGALLLALDPGDEEEIERIFAWQQETGLPVERVPPSRIHGIEPHVSRSAREALLFPYDHHVDNVRLLEAITLSARRRGARFLNGRPVRAIEGKGGLVRGVRMDGERIEADRVLLAAGCWSGGIEGVPEPLPVHPVRGQMLLLRTEPTLLEHVLIHAHHYLVPRGDGRVLAGSTVEHAGFDASVTAGGMSEILASAIAMVPDLAKASVADSWAGLRPGTADGLPIIGPSSLAGLVFATGLYRNGILLGPLTGRLASQLLLSGTCSYPIDAFDPGRFASTGDSDGVRQSPPR